MCVYTLRTYTDLSDHTGVQYATTFYIYEYMAEHLSAGLYSVQGYYSTVRSSWLDKQLVDDRKRVYVHQDMQAMQERYSNWVDLFILLLTERISRC